MTIPHRGSTGLGTYFITLSSFQKTHLFQSERMANLLIRTIYEYREQSRFLLHGFVIMPNHIHLVVTPIKPVTLERAVQFIKGGFSFRVKKQLGVAGEIWQTSFYDRRVRDMLEMERFMHYIHDNPVRRGLVSNPVEYPYSSANPKFCLDKVPQGLKPQLQQTA